MKKAAASPAFVLPSLILIIAVIFINQLHAIFRVKLFSRRISLQVRYCREKNTLLDIAADIIELMRKEGPEEALQYCSHQRYDLTLSDVSSMINLNWMDPSFIDFCARMLSEEGRSSSVENFVKSREKLGFLCNFERGYASIFGTEFCSQYCSSYNYININIISEELLRDYLRKEQGLVSVGPIIKTISKAKEQLVRLKNQAVYSLLEKEKRLWPLISACPVFNVNFVPEELLFAILSYPEFAVDSPERKLEEIVRLRSEDTLRQNELALLLGKASEHLIFQYLGCKTWSYNLVIEKTREEQLPGPEISKAVFLIAQIPPRHPLEEKRFELIGKNFIKGNNQ